MLYIRKLFTQDLSDGKQIAFPKEPSYSFFSFDYKNGEADRRIIFTFNARFEQFQEYEGKVITTRLYAASSESRMDGEVKAFIRDKLKAKVDDLLIFKNKGTKYTEYEVMFVPQNNKYYSLLLKLCGGENHSVYSTELEIQFDKDEPLQSIYYGAPGTGKSHEINEKTKGKSVIRTTFHPDSDYSTFIGAYKPIMKEVDVPVVPVVVNSGIGLKPSGTYKEKRITYQFVKQAFLKAYLGAWKKYADSCSICCTPAVHEFDTSNGRYVINSVGAYDLTLSREFQFSKILVQNEWTNLWNNGVFEVPTGPQTGKSVQHAIANWIFNKIEACTEDKFEEGWQKLLDAVNEKGHVEVQKTQTYIISGVTDNNTLTINVEAQGKKRATLQCKFNDPEKFKATKLEKAVTDILKGYSDDFDEAWELLKQNVNNGVSPEVKNENDGQIVPQFLVVEEINRGNCAQIFGDIFQLLDRSDNGFSVYPIEADSDLRDAIKEAFTEDGEFKLSNGIDIEGVIDYTSNYGSTLSEDVQTGRVLLFPPNLYIWATMNTSDQSLFPIDSAFKRRWEWKYMKIKNERKDWKVDVDLKLRDDEGNESTRKVDWWEFVDKINKIITSMTSSADKQLGYFFCKATEKETGKNEPTIITKDMFVSKVLFYLWNDVFKDYGFDDASLFKYKEIDPQTGKEEEKDLTFPDFYDEAGEKVNTVRLTDFIIKVMNWKKTNEENS